MPAHKLLILVNDAPFFVSHRLPVAVAARAAGYDVAVAAPASPMTPLIEECGLHFIELPMPRKRGSIGRELQALLAVWRLIGRHRPDVVHLVTAKPIIFGGIACRLRGVPALAAVSGLGHVFGAQDAKSRIGRRALLAGYRLALKRRDALAIFQNRENLATFEAAGIVDDRYVMIKGSGADLAEFDPAPPVNGAPMVLLPARMLWTKGVGEFVEAARILRSRGHEVRFVLAGKNDPGNPANIEERQLRDWTSEGAIEWIGYQSDIATTLKQSDIVVLPSYYPEGLPKSLVDASAAGRAIVTTDVPGCRDAIVEGETGLLCRPRDARDLAAKIELLLADQGRRLAMGRAARAFAEREFAIEKIVAQHLECYARLVAGGAGSGS